MAVAEGRIAVARLARGDRTVDGAVQLAERVGEALGVARRQLRRRARGRAEQRRVPQERAVRRVARAEPQLLRPLAVPRERALRAVHLQPDRVLAAGRDLRDDTRAARAA